MSYPSNQGAVKIDAQKFRNWCAKNGKTFKQISTEMGRYDSFISKAVAAGELPARQFELFRTLYGVKPETFAPSEKTVDLSVSGKEGVYSLSLDVKPDKVRVGINFQGVEIFGAYAGVKGDSETNLIQAISYAAHMCYKMAEQKSFAGK